MTVARMERQCARCGAVWRAVVTSGRCNRLGPLHIGMARRGADTTSGADRDRTGDPLLAKQPTTQIESRRTLFFIDSPRDLPGFGLSNRGPLRAAMDSKTDSKPFDAEILRSQSASIRRLASRLRAPDQSR